MERPDTHTAPPELQSRDIYEIENEMNEILGFMKDVVMVLTCIDENSLVFSGPYYLFCECERKMERLGEVCEEMAGRLIRKEREGRDE